MHVCKFFDKKIGSGELNDMSADSEASQVCSLYTDTKVCMRVNIIERMVSQI